MSGFYFNMTAHFRSRAGARGQTEECFFIFILQKQKQTSNHIIEGVLCSFCFYLHVIWCCMCVGEHVCVLVVFVFPGHKHGWFRVRVGHDEVLIV